MHKSNTPKVLKKIEAYAMYLLAAFEVELKSVSKPSLLQAELKIN